MTASWTRALATRPRNTGSVGLVSDGEEQIQAQVILPPEQMAGVWANYAAVSHSEHEFTLDFIRLQYGGDPLVGVVVARISVSPLFITQLIEALQQNWTKYAEKSMPKEVRGGSED
jgi:hypothetical protein